MYVIFGAASGSEITHFTFTKTVTVTDIFPVETGRYL